MIVSSLLRTQQQLQSHKSSIPLVRCLLIHNDKQHNNKHHTLVHRFYSSTTIVDSEEEVPPHYHELICIGGGSGGLSASKRASLYLLQEQTQQASSDDVGASTIPTNLMGDVATKKSSARVALIDSRAKTEQQVNLCKPSLRWGLGGTCVNVGCIPKKLFHASSLVFESVVKNNDLSKFGLPYNTTTDKAVVVNWKEFSDQVMNYIKSINFGYRGDLMSASVEIVSGNAKFVDRETIEVTLDRGNKKKRMKAKNFVIAVGGSPTIPDIPGSQYVITSDEIFYLRDAPGKTLVVGAGYIALECAGFLNGLGFPTTVMYRSVPLRSFDQECAAFVVKHLEHAGARIMPGKVITRIEKNDVTGKLKVYYTSTDATQEESEEYDTVMYAIGRTSHKQCESLHLDNAGVTWDRVTGKIITNESDQTSTSNIYAIGDCAQSPSMAGYVSELTPVAIRAGKLLASRLYGDGKQLMNYDNVPTAIFTPVEYACVGLSEEQAIRVYGVDNLEIYHLHYNSVENSFLKRELNTSFMKMICLKTENERIVGFHYCGPNAGEMIHGVAVALKNGATKTDFDDMVGVHPTAAEEMFSMQVTKRSGLPAEKHGC